MIRTVSFIIKSEGTAIIDDFSDGFNHMSNVYSDNSIVKKICGIGKTGVDALKLGLRVELDSILRIEKGIMSPELLSAAYPEFGNLSPDIRRKMELAYIGNPYSAVTFTLPEVSGEDLYRLVQKIKGQMSGISPSLGIGLRGFLFKKIIKDNPCYSWDKYPNAWLQTGNFIHISDDFVENTHLFNYLDSKGRKDSLYLLYDKNRIINGNEQSMSFNSVWDVYKLLDQGIHLTSDRTNKEVEFLQSVLPINRYSQLLDIACGKGRIATALGRKGYDIFGFDIDGSEINKARLDASKIGLNNVRFEVGSYSGFNTYERIFDGAYMVYGTFNMLSDNEILNLLERINKSLRRGGRLIIDLLNKTRVKSKSNGETVELTNKTESNNFRAFRRRLISDSGDFERTEFTIKMPGKTEETYVYEQRLFDLSEIINILQMSGFLVKQKYSNFDGSEWELNGSRMIVVAEKI